MSFEVERFPDAFYPQKVAARIAVELPAANSVVLTGGTTAEKIYRPLAETGVGLAGKKTFFSDERCVPPDDDASNFAMANRTLLSVAGGDVYRMRGEDPPTEAARLYSEEVRAAAPEGFDLLLLGMGADCHVGAMFPGSPALAVTDAWCAPVDRPDGMKGLTLTPPAMLTAKRILLLVSSPGKADAVARVIHSQDRVEECPARLLVDHPDVTFLLDEGAASALGPA